MTGEAIGVGAEEAAFFGWVVGVGLAVGDEAVVPWLSGRLHG